MNALLVWMGGGDSELLARCPTERLRFAALGGAVATTAMLAAAAATFAASDWLHISLAAGIVVGAFWGLAIMNLDRWLLIATRRQSSPLKTVVLALPRVFLAIVVGLVIAEPLVLRVFRNEVTAQATEQRQTEFQAAVRKLDAGYAQIPKLERRKAGLESSIATIDRGAVLRTNPEYRAVSRQLTDLQRRRDQAEHDALCELERTCGSRGGPGSPAYAANHQRALALKGSVRAKQQQLRELRGQLLRREAINKQRSDTSAGRELAHVTAQLGEQRAQRSADERELSRTSHAPIGLLERVEALGALTRAHPSMRYERYLLQLFILLVDTVPIIFKTLTLLGRPTLYEQVRDESDVRNFDRLRMRADKQAIADEIEAETVVNAATSRQKHLQRVLDALSEKIVRTQREAAERAIVDWTARVRAQQPSAPGVTPGGAGNGNPTGAAPSGNGNPGATPYANGDRAGANPNGSGAGASAGGTESSAGDHGGSAVA